jgi:PAS domain S-box-containing protein
VSPYQPWAHGLDEIQLHDEAGGFSREAFAELLENVPLAISVTLGPRSRFAFANRLFRAALAVPDEDLAGRTVADVMGNRYTQELQAFRQQAFETGETRELTSAPLTLTPGRTTYWDIKFLPVRDAAYRISGVLTLAANVTERVLARHEADRKAREAELHNERLALAVETTELGLWEWDARTGQTFWSDRQKEIFGLPKDAPASYEFWLSALHPEERDRVTGSIAALLDAGSGGQLHIEHRIIRPDGEIRWISSRGRMLYEIENGDLKPARLLGTILDITERRRSEEARQLLVQELNHRVKNLFAMASGMVALTARTAENPQQMATALRGRLEALARAHELIRPALKDGEPSERVTSISEIVGAVLAPHMNHGAPSQMTVEGPPVVVGSKAATGLTLVLHELATNASKYGALSVHEGCLRIRWTCDEDALTLLWQEQDGPPVARAPDTEGFGSKLARKSVTDQLGGEVVHDWRPEGLQVRIRLPLGQLSH